MRVPKPITWNLLAFTFAGLLAASPAHARRLTIVALGDSTTEGTPFLQSSLESPPQGRGNPEAFYGYWIHQEEPEWTVLNQGLNGQRTDQIARRLNLALALHPSYVIILAGVNDIYQGVDFKTITNNLSEIYLDIRSQHAFPVAATVLPFDRATSEQIRAIHRLNDWIRQTAQTRQMPWIDLNKAVASPLNPDLLIGSPDGLHPDLPTYRKMGVALLEELRGLERSR